MGFDPEKESDIWKSLESDKKEKVTIKNSAVAIKKDKRITKSYTIRKSYADRLIAEADEKDISASRIVEQCLAAHFAEEDKKNK